MSDELSDSTKQEISDWFLGQAFGLDMETVRKKSLEVVKTYKIIKNVIWQCSIKFSADGEEISIKNREVDTKLLLGLMDEI